MKKTGAAFTLIEIMIIIAVIGIILGIALPSALQSRYRAQGVSCNENLSKIESAKQQYAIENNLPFDSNLELGPGILIEEDGTGYLKRTPFCPASGVYAYGDIQTPPTCDQQNTDTGLHLLP